MRRMTIARRQVAAAYFVLSLVAESVCRAPPVYSMWSDGRAGAAGDADESYSQSAIPATAAASGATITDLMAFASHAVVPTPGSAPASSTCVRLQWKVRQTARHDVAPSDRPLPGIEYRIRCCLDESELAAGVAASSSSAATMTATGACEAGGEIACCRASPRGDSGAADGERQVVWLLATSNLSSRAPGAALYATVSWKVGHSWSGSRVVRLLPLERTGRCPRPPRVIADASSAAAEPDVSAEAPQHEALEDSQDEQPPAPRQNRIVCIIAVSPVAFMTVLLSFYAIGLKRTRVDRVRYVFPRSSVRVHDQPSPALKRSKKAATAGGGVDACETAIAETAVAAEPSSDAPATCGSDFETSYRCSATVGDADEPQK